MGSCSGSNIVALCQAHTPIISILNTLSIHLVESFNSNLCHTNISLVLLWTIFTHAIEVQSTASLGPIQCFTDKSGRNQLRIQNHVSDSFQRSKAARMHDYVISGSCRAENHDSGCRFESSELWIAGARMGFLTFL